MKNNQKIEDFLMSLIESKIQGNWEKPWIVNEVLSMNFFNKRFYDVSGVNAVILPLYASIHGFRFSKWATFNQIKKAGYTLQKGAKGCIVVFWKIIEVKKENGEVENVPLLRFYYVFNIENIVNDDGESIADTILRKAKEGNEEMYKGLKFSLTSNTPEIKEIETDCACYFTSYDRIQLPFRHTFKNIDYFTHVLLHELAHSTGNKERTGREERIMSLNLKKDEAYALEEIIADFSASYLCSFFALEQNAELLRNNAAIYARGWNSLLDAFNVNNKMLSYFIFKEVKNCVSYMVKNYMEVEGDEELKKALAVVADMNVVDDVNDDVGKDIEEI